MYTDDAPELSRSFGVMIRMFMGGDAVSSPSRGAATGARSENSKAD
jgi:hypothetical protein